MLTRQVGRLIKEHRLLEQWTQAELAHRAGVSRTAVARLERIPAPSMQTGVIDRVLRALELDLDVTVAPAERRLFGGRTDHLQDHARDAIGQSDRARGGG